MPSHRVFSRVALACGMLLCFSVSARGQDAIGGPISGSIGAPIYTESTQTGPSSSLIPGGGKLTSSFLRTGISDPLSFLIESGLMSPYTPEGGLITSYANAAVPEQVVNDSTIAERVSDYRNNGELMSGAGAARTLASRTGAAGSTLSGRSGAKAANAASGSFSGLTARAPFAAGSSSLASQQGGVNGMSSLVDPNAALAAANSSPDVATMQGASASSGSATDSDTSGTVSGTTGEDTSIPGATGILVPAPTSTAYGPGPGDLFPDVSVSSVSPTGFKDSTMGTAGLPTSAGVTPFSRPLLSIEEEQGDPFPSMSAETTSFLHPSLLPSGAGGQTSADASQPTTGSLRELTRKARIHAMIYNPGAIPSPFEQRALVRNYERNKGRQVHRHSSLTAPSVTH